MTNHIKKFCSTDSGTNLLTNAEYLADAQRLIGNQPGIARDKLVNKVLRQSAFISSTFADYLIQQVGGDVNDDDNTAVLLAKITAAFATGIPVAGIVNMPTSAIPTGFLKCNGAAISRSTYSTLFGILVTDPGFSLQTFTVTIATPGVVTKTAHGFVGGERLRLTTTGALPTGLSLLTDYFVKYIDANTFSLQTIANVLAGTVIATSGSQSGVHSYLRSHWGLGDGSTTFNVPDLRGAFQRVWDDGRGLDASRVVASLQMDAFQNITGALTGKVLGSLGSGGALTATSLATSLYGGGGGNGYNVGFDASLSSGARTSTETRPINYAMMPVIKY